MNGMKRILSAHPLEGTLGENDEETLYDVVYEQDGFVSSQHMEDIDVNGLKDVSEKPILQEQRPILQELYWRSWQSENDGMVFMEDDDMEEYVARDDNPYTTVEEAVRDAKQGQEELGINTLAFGEDDAAITVYSDFCSTFRHEDSAFKDLSRDDEKNNGWLLSLSAVLSTDPYGTSVTVLGDEEEAKKFFSDEISEHLEEDEKDDAEDYVEEGYFDSGDTRYRIIEANLSNSVREAIVNQSKDHGMKKGEANIGERAKAMQELIDAGIADYRKVKSYLKKQGLDTDLIHQRGTERA